VRFEHALLVLEGTVDVEGHRVETGDLAYVGPGHQVLAVRTDRSARLLLLGGEPFDEPILMWWNFVARSRAEVELATREWNAEDPRFGSVASPLNRIAAPRVPEGLHGRG
jgi:redox-sensitive bicupin YhaK (pirin superfamily)